MASFIDLGQRVKAKYPQYSTMDDEELGRKIAEKYPQYRSFVDDAKDDKITPGGVLTGVGKGLLSTLTNASALGEKAVRGLTKAALPKALESRFTIDDNETGAERLVPEEMRTPQTTAEKVGFIGEQIAELIVPQSKLANIGKGASLIKRGAIEATGSGAQLAIQEGDINSAVIGGAGVAGVFPVMGKIFGPLGKQITETIPLRFIRSALKQSKKELLAGKDAAETIISKAKIGTTKQIIEGSENEISRLNKLIKENLAKATDEGATISRNDLFESIVKEINEQGGAISVDEVFGVVNKLAPQARGLLKKDVLPIIEANKLRQSIDRTLGDRGFLTSQLPFEKGILRDFVNRLRESIKTKAPKGTRELYDEISKEITIRDSLVDKLAQRSRNQVLSFGDFIGGGLGGIFGGGIGGAVLGVGTRRALESTVLKTSLGVNLAQLQKLQGAIQALIPLERAILLEALRLFSNDEDDEKRIDN